VDHERRARWRRHPCSPRPTATTPTPSRSSSFRKTSRGLEVGKKEDKLGLRASDTTTLIFDDVRIPAENRLTEVGRGLKAAFSILTGGRVAIASQAVGVAQAALDDSVQYANEREQFGEPIIEHQAISQKLADMQTDVQAGALADS